MRSLLLADIDGTLVDSMGELWPEAYCVAQSAAAANWAIALCSARSTWTVEPIAERLGNAVAYIVSFQGAVISKKTARELPESSLAVQLQCTWKVVRRHFLENSVATCIERLVPKTESLWWYTEKGWWVRAVDEAAFFEAQAVHSAWSGVGKPDKQDRLIKLLVVCPNRAEHRLQRLKALGLPISCYASQAGYIEIVSSVVADDKGTRDLQALERGDHQLPFTVAIGDARNDLGMFANSHVALTFGDASADVRRAADVVLCADRHLALKQLCDLIIMKHDKAGGLKPERQPYLEPF